MTQVLSMGIGRVLSLRRFSQQVALKAVLRCLRRTFPQQRPTCTRSSSPASIARQNNSAALKAPWSAPPTGPSARRSYQITESPLCSGPLVCTNRPRQPRRALRTIKMGHQWNQSQIESKIYKKQMRLGSRIYRAENCFWRYQGMSNGFCQQLKGKYILLVYPHTWSSFGQKLAAR